MADCALNYNEKLKKFFKTNTRRKEAFEAFSSYTRRCGGYTDPFKEFDSDDYTEKEIAQAKQDFIDFAKKFEYDEELEYCKSMLESKVAYGWDGIMPAKDYIKLAPSYLYTYIGIFGEDVVISLLQEIMDSVDHIEHGSYTDSEGCVYNSIIFKQ